MRFCGFSHKRRVCSQYAFAAWQSFCTTKNTNEICKNILKKNFTSMLIAQVATETYTDIVKAWKLDDSDAEKLLGVKTHTWMQIKSGKWRGPLEKEQLMRISAIIGLHRALHSCFNGDLANRWVKRPNAGSIFSGRKPIDVMIDGGLPVMIETRRYMKSAGC